MTTATLSPQSTATARPPRPGSDYFWNPILAEWLRNPSAMPKVALTHRHPNGTIHALSSDGHTVYTVTLSPETCTCPAGENGRRCYHVDTAARRYRTVAAQPVVCEQCRQCCTDARGCPCCQAPKPCDCPACEAQDPEPLPAAAPAIRRFCACLLAGGTCERCRPAGKVAA